MSELAKIQAKANYSNWEHRALVSEACRLSAKVRELEYDLGQTKIQLEHKTTLLESCEQAIEQRDAKYFNESREAQLAELQQGEPVAWAKPEMFSIRVWAQVMNQEISDYTVPLYAAPQAAKVPDELAKALEEVIEDLALRAKIRGEDALDISHGILMAADKALTSYREATECK